MRRRAVAAMTLARERHGIFVFTGNTRHRVEVDCLKDFDDPRFVPPSGSGWPPAATPGSVHHCAT